MSSRVISRNLRRFFIIAAMALSSLAEAKPLQIGYSDWPGWVAWEVALEKGWFKEAGVEVEFEWFDYVASMEAYSAGQLDAVGMTNGDALVTGATGAKSVFVLINDYSNGNDMIVAQRGITSVADLAGKRIGVEIGFVPHLLLLNALESAGLTEDDVELVNAPTNETPQVLASGDVDAIVAWQPSSSQALKLVPGSKAIYTSRNQPGLIFDGLAVSPMSLATRRDDWLKVVDVWYRVVDYIRDPDTAEEALSIVASRVGLSAEDYRPFLAGTKILDRSEVVSVLSRSTGFDTVHGSSLMSDAFNVKYGAYKDPQDVADYLDTSLMLGD